VSRGALGPQRRKLLRRGVTIAESGAICLKGDKNDLAREGETEIQPIGATAAPKPGKKEENKV